MDLKELASKINVAITIGQMAAEAQPNDGGSANLDHVVVYGLKGVRESAMEKAGINCHKGRYAGEFHLTAPFSGQGNRRYAGVQAMCKSLKDAGVDCYVYYMMD